MQNAIIYNVFKLNKLSWSQTDSYLSLVEAVIVNDMINIAAMDFTVELKSPAVQPFVGVTHLLTYFIASLKKNILLNFKNYLFLNLNLVSHKDLREQREITGQNNAE